jgi:protocatechuate 3,4-dioxygenase beta subunit
MKREAMWTKAAIYGLVAAAALVVACQPPVSNEAALVVEGRILGVDGQPLANQAVNL